MNFGKDFFKIFQFAVAVIRLVVRIFGNDEEKKLDDEFGANHLHDVDETVKKYVPPE